MWNYCIQFRKIKKRPLLLSSDMEHKSTLENTYYVFPIIYDKDNDQEYY